MENQQSEALRLADIVERLNVGVHSQAIVEEYSTAARELRRQHARIQELEATLEVKAINPLTDEQLSEIAKEHTRSVGCYNCYEQAIPDRHNRIEDFARAIERAHGIGATPCN